MNRRMLLGTILFLIIVPLAGCSLNSDYTTTVGEPTNGTVIENTSAEFVDDWSGVRYEIEYNHSYRNASGYSFKTYERVKRSLELRDSPRFIHIEPSTPPVYQNDVAPPWDSGERRMYEIRVVNETTDTVVDAVSITVKKNGS